ncbi:hypothetical protein A1O7_06631 [Cladophialophora yegresii CBS 114405]|uniref:Uncharacterized protein n=1 Tax=Cladophialophora yegresii CBS 114405 TaxID=1182544 RepID=W9WL49_9EURO|nr:uncharacterized protein A1O7_06631 [Cladophialophora yegresii CBS 114405]EXJ59199.1 hypothetical protein A1O7_06631 [Cladophialophora yegresii CBS 114405]
MFGLSGWAARSAAQQLPLPSVSPEDTADEVSASYPSLEFFPDVFVDQTLRNFGVPAQERTIYSASALGITLLRENKQLYEELRSSHGHSVLQQIATMFTMSEELCLSGVQTFTHWLRQSPSHTIASLRRFMLEARGSFRELNRAEPGLSSEWVQCQEDLHLYTLFIEECGLHRQTGSTPIFSPSELKSPPLSETSTDPASAHSTSGHSNASSQRDFAAYRLIHSGIWPLIHRDSASTTVEASCEPGDLVLPEVWQSSPKAESSMEALIGWVYRGQLIASSFTVYVRVFIRLAQIGMS